jgi:hypothetical protein
VVDVSVDVVFGFLPVISRGGISTDNSSIRSSLYQKIHHRIYYCLDVKNSDVFDVISTDRRTMCKAYISIIVVDR